MNKAIVVLANGEQLKLSAGQLVYPLFKDILDGETHATPGQPVELTPHIHEGMIPAVADLLCSCEFFSFSKSYDKLYKTSAVVSVARD